ncbi:MAG: histidine phosphatase family protein [Gemmataceae bacterium]|nr:histidine phosphatase family protein [Gemmataceae bacterium]
MAISDVGVARAKALAEITRQAGVQVIITTQFLRTKQTAGPTADALGLTPTVVATQADLPGHLAAVAAAARQQAGKTVLVVGHSNTVPGIVAALGGTKYPDLCDAEYDALFTLVIDAEGSVRTVRTRFGEPTPVGAGCARMR